MAASQRRDVPLTGGHRSANAGEPQTSARQPLFPEDESLVRRDTVSRSVPFTACFCAPPSICPRLFSLRKLDHRQRLPSFQMVDFISSNPSFNHVIFAKLSSTSKPKVFIFYFSTTSSPTKYTVTCRSASSQKHRGASWAARWRIYPGLDSVAPRRTCLCVLY